MADHNQQTRNPTGRRDPLRRKTGGYVRLDRAKNRAGRAQRRAGTSARPSRYALITSSRVRAGRAPTRTFRPSAGEVVVRERGVTIAGSPRAVEDYLDAQEIDRRLADPENRPRIPWAELKARRGL